MKIDFSLFEECGVRNVDCQVGYGNSKGPSEEYGGYERHTNGSIECQRWSSDVPHGGHEKFNGLAEDWCRNPDDSEGVWCYTMEPEKRWDYCPVRRCSYCDTGSSLTGNQ